MMRKIAWLLALAAGLLPAVARAGDARPNILFAVADDASWPYMGAYGCNWVKTPGFDRVARDGILFANAYTPNAKCAPSRSCILTGRNSWQLKAAANHWCYFPAEFKAYTEVLSENGYFVGMTGKGWGPGVARDADDKPRQLAGRPFQARKLTPPPGISNTDYAGNFADFLQARPKGQPFCFWYGATEPHRGYQHGIGVARGGKKIADIDRVPACWPDTPIVRTDMLDYAFELEHFDRHLVRMLEMLDKAGELDNTLVIVTADNGMPFPHGKGQCYDMSNHMPLAIMWPAGIRKPGRVVDDFVSFIDFAPTYLELAKAPADRSGMAPITGRSLMDIFSSEKPGRVNPQRDHVLIGKERHDVGRPNDWGYPIRGIVTDTHLYLRNYEPDRWPAGDPETGYLNCDGGATKTVLLEGRRAPAVAPFWALAFGRRPAEELYDLRADRDCVRNLAAEGATSQVKHALAARMEEALKQQEDPRMLGQGRVFDEYPYADPNHRDFYNRFMKGEKLNAGWVSPGDFQKD